MRPALTSRASPDRFATISDIHGNLAALDAVLNDIAVQGIATTVNLGDHLQGPLDPAGTAERLIPLDLLSIRGNCDRLLFESGTVMTPGSTLASNRSGLSDRHKRWLAAMPQTITLGGDILLCHGTPWADDVYLLEEVTPDSVRMKHVAEIAPVLDGLSANLILCGHSHVGCAVQIPGGPLVVNPGSVGLPAYTEVSPHPHAMEAGSPHARYAVLTRSGFAWSVEHRAVVYDWESAARMAERNLRPDWATWLRTGRA